ncbi:MAG: DUF2383 domain-containing protein, partial [Hymenobacter sp.]
MGTARTRKSSSQNFIPRKLTHCREYPRTRPCERRSKTIQPLLFTSYFIDSNVMANETITRAFTDILNLNRTSVKGYQEAAEEVSNPELKSQLSQFSQQRAGFVSDLEGYAKQYGIEA